MVAYMIAIYDAANNNGETWVGLSWSVKPDDMKHHPVNLPTHGTMESYNVFTLTPILQSQ
jgi:hypothetical protein